MPRTFQATVQDVIDKVRTLTQDTTATYRTSDAELIGWLNDALSTLVALVPQHFTVTDTHTCTAGSRQVIATNRAHSMVEVIGVPFADYAAMSAFKPTWQTDTAGAIQNWLRAVNEPLVFFTYPKQAGGESLSVMLVKAHDELTAVGNTILLPETFEPALVAYCVGMVESKDDEHVNSNRAQAAMADFAGRITGGKA